MSLTVCCATADPGPRVRATLGQLRGIADEIVVAVDSRVDPARLGHYAAHADKLLRFEFTDSVTRSLGWLHAQCTGDWILRIDGDELLSPRLLAQLPDLLQRTAAFQFALPCMWLYPDPEHYLDQPPWSFDAVRLVRNDPATLWFGGLSHSSAEPAFPAPVLEHGFYHLAHLLLSEHQLEAKVEHYLSIASGHPRAVIERDVPMAYLPHRHQHSAPREISGVDRAAIAEVLAACGPEIPGPADVQLATRAEIDRHWQHRRLSAGAYRARIEPLFTDRGLSAGEHRALSVRVHNDSNEEWPGGARQPMIRLSYRWHDAAGRPQVSETPRTPFPAPVPSRGSAVLPVNVQAPGAPGRYLLHFDLVHEGVRWFGRESTEIEFAVA